MLEKQQNLCKSVIEEFSPKSQWVDEVYLAETCKERFLTTNDIPELENQGIFMAGMAELRDEYYVERLGVSVHTLLFTLEGGGILITSDNVQFIEPYSLVVLPAETPFRFELNPENTFWKMAWVLPVATEKWAFIDELGQCIVPFGENERLWSLMHLMHIEIGGRASFRNLLVSEMIRLISGFEPKSTSSPARVQALFNDIESQLHLPWTVQGMAEKVFMSEEQLNRISKSLFGLSPRSKLIQLRMEKALSLLNQQEWSVSMISQRLGYKDPYNFSHRFKKHFGQSPSQYRKSVLRSLNQDTQS
ncbi:AraC family transcriptional regulator [Vibrio sp. T187]|uniref:AraC family transcriptional regulator n=1 Tax=Vibrio TaxID=662 RepID=UPI0010C93C87|nr:MULTISPECIES: AraC family transcriptional regulator [Vibrio]MBW3698099.1 AraC family transcriptional regulator [Vibrio sp. T187]